DGASREQHPIEREQNNRAEYRHQEPGVVVRAVPTRRAADESAEQGAGNAQQHGDDEAARVPAGHDELRDHPDDQPENDPSQDMHVATSVRTTACKRRDLSRQSRGIVSRYFSAPPVLNSTTDSVGLIDPLATSRSIATSPAPLSGAALTPSHLPMSS